MSNKNNREAHREALRRSLTGRNAGKRKEDREPATCTQVNMGSLVKKLAERLEKK